MKDDKRKVFVSLMFFVIIVISVLTIVINREWIFDFWRGLGYEPSIEMGQIRDDLDLTDRGRFLFDASRPELKDREDFNEKCRSNEDTETAVLGCYTEKTIYVYDINEKELEGIRELTSSHELLHAVWARMNDGEKNELKEELSQVLEANEDFLMKEIDNYNTNERLEELYVRAGTEIKELPTTLEKHYEKVFKNQDKIVDFYNSYIEVFRHLEAEMDSLKTEMNKIEEEINEKTIEYKSRASNLDKKIIEFNNCAKTAGCFSSEYQFNRERGVLIAEKQALGDLYEEIDGLIKKYNENVEKYNNDVLHNNRLMKIVNSNETVEEID